MPVIHLDHRLLAYRTTMLALDLIELVVGKSFCSPPPPFANKPCPQRRKASTNTGLLLRIGFSESSGSLPLGGYNPGAAEVVSRSSASHCDIPGAISARACEFCFACVEGGPPSSLVFMASIKPDMRNLSSYAS